jgi:fatty acid desaturase
MTTMPSPADPADLQAAPSSAKPRKRDYSLTGESARHAIEAGLAAAEWYHTDIPRKAMKELMQRRDGPAIRDTLVWAALHVLFATGGIWFWGTWWAVPFWLAYGVMYGSACDARWHECGHGTAFRTRWMNDVVYQIASFQVMRNPVSWRWSHARHHTDTIIVGRDAEIAWMLPPNFLVKALHFVGIYDVYTSLKTLAKNAMGQLSDDEKDYLPESERPKAVFAARVHMAIYAATLLVTAWMLAAGYGWKAAIPFLLIGGPRIYGCWHFIMTGLLQHGGLAEDVLDHRLNSRTVYMNPVSRFIYWNMNYHVEHHMFPMVPYYNLPKLHDLIKHDLPAPNPSIWHAYKEMLRATWRQRKDPDYYLERQLPPTAKPYRKELHTWVPERGMA